MVSKGVKMPGNLLIIIEKFLNIKSKKNLIYSTNAKIKKIYKTHYGRKIEMVRRNKCVA